MEQSHRLSFAAIDAGIQSLGMESVPMESQSLADATQRLITIYHAVQPILAILAALPLLPQRWRDALRAFVTALDQVASFKAGKDL
jgi:hypothetical protein